jgi:hypothetical protein
MYINIYEIPKNMPERIAFLIILGELKDKF